MTTPSMSIVKGSATNAAAGSAITESRGVLSVVLGKEAPLPLVAGQVNKIKAQSGQHWKLVREQADKTGAGATDNVIAMGQGDDLVLRYEDGTLVTVEGFFAVCADASVCSVTLPGDAAEGFTLSGDSARGVVLGEEGTLLYAHGTPDVLRTMAQGQPKLSTALSGLGESSMVTYRPTSDSLGVGNFTPTMLGLLGAGGAVALAGGGGGNSPPVPDITAPTVVITDDEATPTGNIAGGDITYTFTFSEGVTGFTAADVVVANGSKGTFTAVSATVYTLVVTPTAGFVGNVTVDVAAGTAQDAAGNGNTAAVQSVQGVDMLAPTIVITDDEATPTGNLAGGDITYTFTFSEGVTGFTAADVVVANGSKGTFTAVSATFYTLVVTPTAGFEGNVTVDVAAGTAQDAGGNGNTVAVQSVQGVDMLAPTAPTAVTLTPSGGTVVSNTLNASNTALAFQATITAGQATGGSAVFKVGGVTVGSDSSISAGDTSVTFSTSDGTPTSAEVQSAIAAGGVVTVELIDAAGNTVTSSVGNPTLVRDITAPTFASGTTASVAENTSAATVVYDANANDGGGNDVGITYSLGGVDAAFFSINASTGALTFNSSPNHEAPLDAGTNNVYDVTIIATDLAGNAATQSLATTVTNVGEAGETVISLGAYGNLIAPVQVEGNWFYFWDLSGDGTSANSGSLNGGRDYFEHNALDAIFNQDINGVQNTTVPNADGLYGTTDVYRYATLNGVRLALPTYGSTLNGSGHANDLGYQDGTAVNSGAQTNATFDGLLAIWDAYNGSSTSTGMSGVPTGWASYYYHSASSSTAGHAGVDLASGFVFNGGDALGDSYIALQVL